MPDSQLWCSEPLAAVTTSAVGQETHRNPLVPLAENEAGVPGNEEEGLPACPPWEPALASVPGSCG